MSDLSQTTATTTGQDTADVPAGQAADFGAKVRGDLVHAFDTAIESIRAKAATADAGGGNVLDVHAELALLSELFHGLT